MQFKSLVFLSILPLLFFNGCGSKEKEAENSNTHKTEKIKKTDFLFTTIDNEQIQIKLKDNKIIFNDVPNKIVLLNFFATWCPSCIAEVSNLIKIQNDFKNDLKIISILLEDKKTNEEIKNFIKDSEINYTIINSKESYEFTKSLGEIKSIPTMYLIDKNSNIFQKYIGIVPFEMLEIDIKKILAK